MRDAVGVGKSRPRRAEDEPPAGAAVAMHVREVGVAALQTLHDRSLDVVWPGSACVRLGIPP